MNPPSTALEPLSWVSRTIDAIVVHSSSEDQLDSDILLPETVKQNVVYNLKICMTDYGCCPISERGGYKA
jgi:hypothetical protein